MILLLIKKEEYREIKDAWFRIFENNLIKIKGRYYNPKDVVICFSNGYKRNRPQMMVQCEGLSKKSGKTAWGAKKYKIYLTLKLGDILSIKNINQLKLTKDEQRNIKKVA